MPDVFHKYEQQHVRNIARSSRRIQDIYNKAINVVSITAGRMKFKGKPFNLNDYPQLKNQIDKVIKSMRGDIYTVVVNGIETSWDLSNEKNNVLVDKRLLKTRLPKRITGLFYDPNADALTKFIQRKDKGMNLSQRVWNLVKPFKKELEQSLGLGIADGTGAREMAKTVQKYLNEPERLYRRVRGKDGELHLSKAAREYHPGQGVYRSSFKNALRLTRTENNIAYRTSDHERWATMPFVTGIEIRLSNNHPRYDICDTLKGKYPKEFKFTGWHPQCICYQVPEMMNDKEFEKLEDYMLGIGKKPSAVSGITKPPALFKQYLQDNKDRIKGWKNKPYWLKDNPQFVK